MSAEAQDRQEIRDVIEGWVIWRDSGDWQNFRTCWHKGATVNVTWFQGHSDQFVERAMNTFAKGGHGALHSLGGIAIALKGGRAIAQTKMTISTRDDLEGVACDIVAAGRFYDFFEKREGRWAIVERHAIYERDRFDPLDPSEIPEFDLKLLHSFPEAYRHLAYVLTRRGLPVSPNMPLLRGPEVEKLYARGNAWLAQES